MLRIKRTNQIEKSKMQSSMKDIGQAPSVEEQSSGNDEDQFYEQNLLTDQCQAKITYIVKQKKSDETTRLGKGKNSSPSEIEISAANLLSDDDRKLWLSSKRNSNFPQTLIIDLTQANFNVSKNQGDLFFGQIGFRCWHAYTTNPESIKISLSSSDQLNFVPWQTFSLAQKAGTQVCTLRERVRAKSLKYIKLEILSTFASLQHTVESQEQRSLNVNKASQTQQQTYLNQIMLYRYQPDQKKSIFMNNDQQQLEHLLSLAPTSDRNYFPQGGYNQDNASSNQNQQELHLFGQRQSSQQPSIMPSAISCNVSQQPDLNLMMEEDGNELIFDTSSFQFPTSISNNTNNMPTQSQANKTRTTFQSRSKKNNGKLSDAIQKTHLVSVQPQVDENNDHRFNLPLQNYFSSIDSRESKPNKHHHYQTTLLSNPDGCFQSNKLNIEQVFTGVYTPVSQQVAQPHGLFSNKPMGACTEIDEVVTASEDYHLTSHHQNGATSNPSQNIAALKSARTQEDCQTLDEQEASQNGDCECERLPELQGHLKKLKGFTEEQTRLISQLFKQDQIEFNPDFMLVLDSLMQAYGKVQKQIHVLNSKTNSLQGFKQKQDAQDYQNQQQLQQRQEKLQQQEQEESRYDIPLSHASSIQIAAKKKLAKECMQTCQQFIESQFDNFRQSRGLNYHQSQPSGSLEMQQNVNSIDLRQKLPQPLLIANDQYSSMQDSNMPQPLNQATFNDQSQYNRQHPIQLRTVDDQAPYCDNTMRPPLQTSSIKPTSRPGRNSHGHSSVKQSTQNSQRSDHPKLIHTFRTGDFNIQESQQHVQSHQQLVSQASLEEIRRLKPDSLQKSSSVIQMVSSRTQDPAHQQTSIEDVNENILLTEEQSSPTRSNLEKHISDFIQQKNAIKLSRMQSRNDSLDSNDDHKNSSVECNIKVDSQLQQSDQKLSHKSKQQSSNGQDSNHDDKIDDEQSESHHIDLNSQDQELDGDKLDESVQYKRERIVKLQDDIDRYLQSSEDEKMIDLPMIMDDAWIHQRIDQNQGSSVVIMGQSERSELVTNRLRQADETGQILRREDLNSGGGNTAEKKFKQPQILEQYLEVIRDESEEHVVQMMHERSNSFFIDGSVAQTERQDPAKHGHQSQTNLSTGQRKRYVQDSSSKDLLHGGKSSVGQESSDLTQPPSFGERYIYKRGEAQHYHQQQPSDDYGAVPSSVTDTNPMNGGDEDTNYGMLSSLATIEREIKEKTYIKEQKMKELEQKRRIDLMSCSSSSSSVLTIPPTSTIEK